MKETLWRRLARGALRIRQRSDWSGFVGNDWPDRIMHAFITDRFHAKQGRSTARLILHAEGRCLAVYLKRHYRLPWWRGLLAALWPEAGWSPAIQEWQHLQWAHRHGLPVPAAVAVAEYIGPWGRLQSLLAVEELADMVPLNEAIPLAATSLPPATFRLWKRGLTREMARLARQLHDRRTFHKDFYLCHFFIARADTQMVPAWPGRVYLIDLHRLARHPWTWRLWVLKDLGQLAYSSEIGGIDARDRLRFWHAYCASRRPRTFWLRQGVLLKWRRYRRHNHRRRTRS
jgi:heptose I phosphotransferase